MNWKNIAYRIAGALLGILAVLAVGSLIVNQFPVSVAVGYLLQGIVISAIVAIIFYSTGLNRRLPRLILPAFVAVIVLLSVWSAMADYNPSAANSLDRGAKGKLLWIAEVFTNPLLANENVAAEQRKVCDSTTATSRQLQLDAALKVWEDAGRTPEATIIYVDSISKSEKQAEENAKRCVTASVASVDKPPGNSNENNIEQKQKSSINSNACVVSYSSGSCWTITPPTDLGPRSLSSDGKFASSKVVVDPGGNSCVITVPVSASQVEAKEFSLKKGERFAIRIEGSVLFSTDHPRATAKGLSGWLDPNIQGPHTDKVGGLEFGLGSFSDSIVPGESYEGVAATDGYPVLRVVEAAHGRDNPKKRGGYIATITRL